MKSPEERRKALDDIEDSIYGAQIALWAFDIDAANSILSLSRK
jgi:hypothetical protein